MRVFNVLVPYKSYYYLRRFASSTCCFTPGNTYILTSFQYYMFFLGYLICNLYVVLLFARAPNGTQEWQCIFRGGVEIPDFQGEFGPRTYFQGQIWAPNLAQTSGQGRKYTFPRQGRFMPRTHLWGGLEPKPGPDFLGGAKNRQCTCTGCTT